MKKLLYSLLLIPFVLCAQSAVHKASPAYKQWEIVTDIFVGVQTQCLSPEERLAYGDSLSPCQGLRVKHVIPGSPAEDAGLMAGDLILKNNGASVATMEDLLLSVRNTRPGELVHLIILRNGAQKAVPVRVSSLAEPKVVAYASLLERDLPAMEAMMENQGRIAHLLSTDVPDLQEIRGEFSGINQLFPYYSRPGQIRLYYETDSGYVTVTCYAAGITVTVQNGLAVETHQLSQQGDSLPVPLRKVFAEL